MTKTKIKSLAAIDPAAKCDKGFEFEIEDSTTGEGTGMFLTVTGKEGRAYRDVMRKRVDASLRRQAEGKPDVQTLDRLEADAVELCAICTTGWRGIVIDEGEGELPFTLENARRLYSFKFVREQAFEKIENLGNFTGG